MENEIQLNKLSTPRTAHYYTLGAKAEKVKKVWMVIHGYGQHADRIIQKFNHLDLSETLVFAPEGLNKFYWTNKERTPVATWMTSRHRLDEIEDYKQWLDNCFNEVMNGLSVGVEFNLLAFSQGTSTAWRWLTHRKPKLHKFVQWAGEIPPELDYLGMEDFLNSFEKYFIVGDQDQFLNGDNLKKLEALFEENKLKYRKLNFEGKHMIDRVVLRGVVEG